MMQRSTAAAVVLHEETTGVDVEEDGGDDGADGAADTHVERPLEPAFLTGRLRRQLTLVERRVAVQRQTCRAHHACTTDT